MKITTEELFSRSFVISLDGSNRLGDFYANIRNRFPDIESLPRWFSATRVPAGNTPSLGMNISKGHAVGCSNGHFSIVAMARALDWPYVFILEDDCKFTEDANEVLSKAINDLPDDIAILKVGYYIRGNCVYDTAKIKEISNGDISLGECTLGSQAQVIFKRYYDTFLHTMTDVDYLADVEVLSQAWMHAKNPKNDWRYSIYRTPKSIAPQAPTSNPKFRYKNQSSIPSEKTFVLGSCTKCKDRTRYPYLPTFFVKKYVRGGNAGMSNPGTGLMMSLIGLCAFAKAAEWDRIRLVSVEFSGTSDCDQWLNDSSGESRIKYDSFGFPIALDIVADDYTLIQDSLNKSENATDILGILSTFIEGKVTMNIINELNYKIHHAIRSEFQYEKNVPTVLPAWDSILDLSSGESSLARVGEGELAIMAEVGEPTQGYQRCDKELAKKLRNVLTCQNSKCRVALPKWLLFQASSQSPYAGRVMSRFLPTAIEGDYFSHFRQDYLYLDSSMSVPSAHYGFIGNDFVENYYVLVKKILSGRDIIIVTGDSRFDCVQHNIFKESCKAIEILPCPSQQAWESYADVCKKLKEINPSGERMVIACCGPMATVLAYEMSNDMRCLDLGHMLVDYNQHRNGTGNGNFWM